MNRTGLSSGVFSSRPLLLLFFFLLSVFILPSLSIPLCPDYYISGAGIMNNVGSFFFLSFSFFACCDLAFGLSADCEAIFGAPSMAGGAQDEGVDENEGGRREAFGAQYGFPAQPQHLDASG